MTYHWSVDTHLNDEIVYKGDEWAFTIEDDKREPLLSLHN